MARRRRDFQREARWREVVARQGTRGLSVRAFCRREGVAENSFYFWRRTLAERDAETKSDVAAASDKATRRTKANALQKHLHHTSQSFAAAVVTNSLSSECSIEIKSVGGTIVRLPESIAVTQLAELIHALEARGKR